MNKDKVYLKGYVIGRAVDTLGYQGLMVQLENLDVVEIDKNLVHKDIKEPQKVTIPQFVAEYIEFKKKYDFHVYGAMRAIEDHYDKRVQEWFYEGNIETFARAWIDGYEVEKEKKYTVKFKNVQSGTRYLKYDGVIEKWYFGINQDSNAARLCHTKEELEEAGFDWVFDCKGMEVEEVAE